jgi:hypothetical protein
MCNKAINIRESYFEIFTFKVHRGIKLNVLENSTRHIILRMHGTLI